jgi:hypothetical protein
MLPVAVVSKRSWWKVLCAMAKLLARVTLFGDTMHCEGVIVVKGCDKGVD